MKREVAHYTEETKKNVVAAVRSGLSQNSMQNAGGTTSGAGSGPSVVSDGI
ncbi:MAG: hypothetical protein KBS81_00060 [Spirochaetales bacterium]|nr:hypothetical protein [Candidatus Physcosoma equi]